MVIAGPDPNWYVDQQNQLLSLLEHLSALGQRRKEMKQRERQADIAQWLDVAQVDPYMAESMAGDIIKKHGKAEPMLESIMGVLGQKTGYLEAKEDALREYEGLVSSVRVEDLQFAREISALPETLPVPGPMGAMGMMPNYEKKNLQSKLVMDSMGAPAEIRALRMMDPQKAFMIAADLKRLGVDVEAAFSDPMANTGSPLVDTALKVYGDEPLKFNEWFDIKNNMAVGAREKEKRAMADVYQKQRIDLAETRHKHKTAEELLRQGGREKKKDSSGRPVYTEDDPEFLQYIDEASNHVKNRFGDMAAAVISEADSAYVSEGGNVDPSGFKDIKRLAKFIISHSDDYSDSDLNALMQAIARDPSTVLAGLEQKIMEHELQNYRDFVLGGKLGPKAAANRIRLNLKNTFAWAGR